MEAASEQVPSPDQYKTIDPRKYKESGASFALDKAEHTRNKSIAQTDYREYSNAMESFKNLNKPVVFSTNKEKKRSFAETIANRRASMPAPNAYKTENAYKFLSSSPSGSITSRRR